MPGHSYSLHGGKWRTWLIHMHYDTGNGILHDVKYMYGNNPTKLGNKRCAVMDACLLLYVLQTSKVISG